MTCLRHWKGSRRPKTYSRKLAEESGERIATFLVRTASYNVLLVRASQALVALDNKTAMTELVSARVVIESLLGEKGFIALHFQEPNQIELATSQVTQDLIGVVTLHEMIGFGSAVRAGDFARAVTAVTHGLARMGELTQHELTPLQQRLIALDSAFYEGLRHNAIAELAINDQQWDDAQNNLGSP